MVVHILNSYFDVMVKEILANGGFIDKFIGDAIMAVFREEHHLKRAIEACLAVRAQIDKLPALTEDVNFKPSVTIGLNSGEMISGNIGSESLRRLDYTVIGDIVNTAQRVQSAAKPGQILIDDTVYHRVKDSFKCEKVGEVKLKNKSAPKLVWEVIE